MFVGSLIGALLALKVDTAAALAAATGVLGVTAATAHRLASTDAGWVRYRG